MILLGTAGISLFAAYQLIGLSRTATWETESRPTCPALVLVALTFVLLIGLYAFLSGVRATGDQRLIVASVTLLLIAIAGAGLMAFGQEVRVTIPRVGAVALAVLGATVSAWQFWYQNEYGPSQAGRAVALKADLVRQARQPATDVVRATIRLEAVSGTNLSVVGSAYTLTGSRVVRCDRHDRATASEVAKVFNGFLPDPQRSRFAADVREQQPSTVLAAGKFVSDGRRLEPDVPYFRDIVFHVARGRSVRLLRFRAELFAISGGVNLSQTTEPTYELGDDNFLYGFWPVDDDSWFRDLIYGRERWLVIRYELVSEAGKTNASPDLRVTARLTDATWAHGRPSLDDAPALFTKTRLTDPAEPFATTELPLEDIAEPTADDKLPDACHR